MSEYSFQQLLQRSEGVAFPIEDVLSAILPLFRQVAAWHQEEMVAPFMGITGISVLESGALKFDGESIAPKINISRISDIQHEVTSALHVVGLSRVSSDNEGLNEYSNLEVIDAESEPTRPAYVSGYRSWEQLLGHHDAVTDIFLLGQLMASLALGGDFTDKDELSTFAHSRANLFNLNPNLHPILATIIVEMTELNRHRRAQDLSAIIPRLENYREQVANVDVQAIPGFATAGVQSRRKLVQTHLRDRLFEISRRNRLLYFRPTQSSLNLTVASVPLVMNLASIRLDQLFVWQESVSKELLEGASMNLGRWLRFEDQYYLPSALDKIIADARRDRAEYGFAQLRLVVAFLEWHNLKESPEERIVSPLLLLPVELSKKKGIRDQYILDPASSVAEVNPALSYHLNQLYGLRLPESIDLRESSLDQLCRDMEAQIRSSEPGVTLRYADKPEMELIHQRAKLRLSQFQRKMRWQKPEKKQKSSFSYSYSRESFQPLGLQLFREHIEPAPLPQRGAVGGSPITRRPHLTNEDEPTNQTTESPTDTERLTYTLRQQGQGNPYTWEFDVCSLTIGNFNYRKMSLVRDYGALLEGDLANQPFDKIFSLDPRPIDEQAITESNLANEWPVISGDATQASAVTLARTGRSYIIQGPPGTGKSQTITNLIADFVANGKRVLFVCEKRAAIDVVFHRLRQRGLDELCCLIHDSQTDKKAFVMNLKETYERWLNEPDEVESIRDARQALIRQMNQDVESLNRFDNIMRSAPDRIGVPVRQVYHRLAELRDKEPNLKATEIEALPTFAEWRKNAELARRFTTTLSEVSASRLLAQHPLRLLTDTVIKSDRPLQALNNLCDHAEHLLDEIESALTDSSLPQELWNTPEDLRAIVNFNTKLIEISQRDQLELLSPKSALSKSLKKAASELDKLNKSFERATSVTRHWRDKLPPEELRAALALTRASESSLLRFLKPSWWRLKKSLEARYLFSQHSVRPSYLQVLSDLGAEYTVTSQRDELRESGISEFGQDPAALYAEVAQLQASDLSPNLQSFRASLLDSKIDHAALEKLNQLTPRTLEMFQVLEKLLIDFEHTSLSDLSETVRDLREEGSILPDLLPLLTELSSAPRSFADVLRQLPLDPDQLEAASARAGIEELYRNERWLPNFDGRLLAHRSERIAQSIRDWHKVNADLIRAEVRHQFREHVQISTLSATQLDTEGKKLKKIYSTGRRELEHEFSKTMRYRSIRDLADDETGHVVRDLKPIWLMSPLSVSDTLPLDAELFDVVIFDEASQTPIEEAVPALYRARQVIVVGDEMQLPPTTFFSVGHDSEDETFEVEENGERVMVSLDADSLLTQSAKNLPATLLAWHYRSRSESLIGFSNAAFYSGSLYTIPDRNLPAQNQADIMVTSPDDAAANCAALLGRPISFHLMKSSPYEDRRNSGEAKYIAHLVREIFQSGTKLSIGIVAFSEAQQSEIESALETVSSNDPLFAARLEEEMAREEDDQFCGLFVKNLENVQGDERDIIILSICYGPDTNGKMRMNFGPINQRGGEKRLNVIFSRARHHMAVVSSIQHHSITNDYNDGALALKNFLHYAECGSRGEQRIARSILESLNPSARKQLSLSRDGDTVVSQITQALRDRGYTVDENVGQSRFRCNLAIRAANGRDYCAGIIIDTTSHYMNPNVAERFVTQPEILRAFGWRIMVVLTCDWYRKPYAVLDRLERIIRGEAEPAFESENTSQIEVTNIPEIQLIEEESTKVNSSVSPKTDLSNAIRRLEFIEGRSSKFWEIAQDGCTVTVRFGRIGTHGQTVSKNFDSLERAIREKEKLVAEKLRKNYKDCAS